MNDESREFNCVAETAFKVMLKFNSPDVPFETVRPVCTSRSKLTCVLSTGYSCVGAFCGRGGGVRRGGMGPVGRIRLNPPVRKEPPLLVETPVPKETPVREEELLPLEGEPRREELPVLKLFLVERSVLCCTGRRSGRDVEGDVAG